MIFYVCNTMVAGSYITFKDMLRSQCAWRLKSQPHMPQFTVPNSVQHNFKENTPLPLRRSSSCGHFPIHLQRKAIGVLDLPETLSFYQKLAGHALSVSNSCVSVLMGLSKWVDFGRATGFTGQTRKLKLCSTEISIRYGKRLDKEGGCMSPSIWTGNHGRRVSYITVLYMQAIIGRPTT